MTHPPILAVLTGDLVGSQAVPAAQAERAMQQVSTTARALGPATRFTRFRGDGWQMVQADPADILTTALLIAADLRAAGCGLETRIAIGVGRATSLGTENLSDAAGQAFVLSGNALDDMPKQNRLSIAGGRAADHLWQQAILDLVDWQTRQWTAAQAEAIATTLRFPDDTHQTMATKLGLTRQAMQSRLAKAGHHSLTKAILAFKSAIWDEV